MDSATVLVPGANPVLPKTSAPGSSLWSLKTRQDGFAAIDGLPPETLDETKAAYWTLDTLVEAAQEMGIEVGRSQLSGASCCVKGCVGGTPGRGPRARTWSSSQKVEDRRFVH